MVCCFTVPHSCNLSRYDDVLVVPIYKVMRFIYMDCSLEERIEGIAKKEKNGRNGSGEK